MTELAIRYEHPPWSSALASLGQLLHELRKRSLQLLWTFDISPGNRPLFFTGCRYHEWALLTMDRLVREPGGVIIAARL
jgi:hypothetical protein